MLQKKRIPKGYNQKKRDANMRQVVLLGKAEKEKTRKYRPSPTEEGGDPGQRKAMKGKSNGK